MTTSVTSRSDLRGERHRVAPAAARHAPARTRRRQRAPTAACRSRCRQYRDYGLVVTRRDAAPKHATSGLAAAFQQADAAQQHAASKERQLFAGRLRWLRRRRRRRAL